tara:strand:- start:3103 stop:3807 length:705 start_codon:yes stop_codon:yes gene_type:complete
MAANNTIVISFSIALFLLLVLLLLVTYNSKCQMDNVEKFIGDSASQYTLEGNVLESMAADKATRNRNSIAQIAQKEDKFSVDESIGNKAPFYDDQIEAADPLGNAYNKPVVNKDVKQENVPRNNNVESNNSNNENNTACFPRERLTSDDLLPQDANSKWAKVNPISSGEIGDKNFLTAGYHIGINTSLGRNNSLDLRHEPLAPQIPVSPWGISTIVPQPKTHGLYSIGSVENTE